LLKELAMSFAHNKSKLVLVSHQMDIPPEVKKLSVNFELNLPDEKQLMALIKEEAKVFSRRHANKKVSADTGIINHLVNNLKGLALNDARHLVRAAIVDDGAITESDLPDVMQAKYKLMNRDEVLSFEFETSRFTDLAGMGKLKTWLKQREAFFHKISQVPGMESPKGILLLGVQGCGKSMAAKAVAGAWNVPLLRLDFGRLYNKYVGETESNIRQALKTANIMAPCILWIDELEKGVAVNDNEDGTSQRILATLLTWMAESNNQVFIVATSNAIDQLPPELIRKGRLDEVFFVDLPGLDVRKEIFRIHADKRALDLTLIDFSKLASMTEGFSGSEIEQIVVSAIYAAHSIDLPVNTSSMIEEILRTKPLSIVMSEKIAALRYWAKDRTVPVD
jgi:SpoVK/Ycf46/Vps4 family AAA+-type ATPase